MMGQEEQGAISALADELGIAVGAGDADAILSMRFGYQVFGEKNGMMMVAVSGTAVTLGKSDAQIAKDEAHALTETAEARVRYLIDFDGKERGPFSPGQLRDLYAKGKIDAALVTRTEEGKSGPTVEQLLGPKL